MHRCLPTEPEQRCSLAHQLKAETVNRCQEKKGTAQLVGTAVHHLNTGQVFLSFLPDTRQQPRSSFMFNKTKPLFQAFYLFNVSVLFCFFLHFFFFFLFISLPCRGGVLTAPHLPHHHSQGALPGLLSEWSSGFQSHSWSRSFLAWLPSLVRGVTEQ